MAEASTSMDETLAKTGGKKQIRKRQINYTREEQLRIAQFVKDHNIVLFGKAGYCGAKVEERKQKCWADLAQALRSDGGREREWRDVKKKWQDMKSRALKYPADAHLTGGGPPNPPDFVSLKVLEAVAPEVKEGLASSQNEAGLGEVTNSQELEEERTEQDTSVFPDEDVEEMQVVESLNTVAQLIACPSDTALIHNDLEDIKGQLNTIIDLLRKSSSAKEQ